jgi:putative DNA primase/helicase
MLAAEPAEICGRGGGARLDELVLQSWDKKDRGAFFCVNTLIPKQSRRSKETVFEITCLHTDIDFRQIDAASDAVRQRLEELEYVPSKVVHSGHGYHVYWLLSEALPATPKLIAQTEEALRGLANMLGGDPAVCEVARLMRVPGSHNTKNGERLPVIVVTDSGRRYELDDLREWVAGTRPLILRKGETSPSNPFLAATMPSSCPTVDVETRLANMCFQGAGDTSIHPTQVCL